MKAKMIKQDYELPKDYEIEILINNYSKTELAQICVIALEVIREKNEVLKKCQKE